MTGRRVATVLLALTLSPLVVVATPDSAVADPTYRVLITGDSITQGSSGDYTWRYRLWNKLSTTAPGNVSFVGTRTDLYDNVNSAFGSQYYAASFSAKSHSAKWGDSFVDELPNIANQVSASNANVLVAMLGSNDLAYLTSPADTVANLKTYIERARSAKPGLDVVIGEVVSRYDPWANAQWLTAEAAEYATRIQNLASQLNTASERVVVAPTRSGWSPSTQTWDGTHPNSTGEALIAQRISEGLAKIGVGAQAPDISGSKAWSVTAPSVTLSPGSEQIELSWNRTSTGATGFYIEVRLTNTNESWNRLPYAVGGSGWTAGLLAAGGTYQFRIVPAKGTSTGLSGPASTATAGGPTPGTISSVTATSAGDSVYGGKKAVASWGASTNATGYMLSSRVMHNGNLVWDDLPYPVSTRNWTFEMLPPGRRMQFRIQPVRGFLNNSWKASAIERIQGLPGERVYVALGDSYSSGLGSEQGYFDDACKKATNAWAFKMQPAFQASTSLQACQGKTIAHIRSTQLPALKNYFAARPGSPQLVTLTVGGNDVGFSDLLKACAIGPSCTGREAKGWTDIDSKEGPLTSLYTEIKTAAPYADIVVGGYPWVLEPTGSSNNAVCLGIGQNEREMFTRLSTHLNNTIIDAANEAGVWTVGNSVRSIFVGHNACVDGANEWIHAGNRDFGGEMGLVDMKSFHPKDSGQLAYAIAFSNTLIALSQ